MTATVSSRLLQSVIAKRKEHVDKDREREDFTECRPDAFIHVCFNYNVEDTVSVARGDRSLHTHQVLRVISMETDMFTSSIKRCTNSVEDSGSFTFHISMLVCALFSSQR